MSPLYVLNHPVLMLYQVVWKLQPFLLNYISSTYYVFFLSNVIRIFRFIIHKHIRRDLIPSLPLPRRMIDYLNTPHYYSEHFIDLTESNEDQLSANDGTIPRLYSRNRLQAFRRGDEEDDEIDPNVPVNYIIMNNPNSDVIRQS